MSEHGIWVDKKLGCFECSRCNGMTLTWFPDELRVRCEGLVIYALPFEPQFDDADIFGNPARPRRGQRPCGFEAQAEVYDAGNGNYRIITRHPFVRGIPTYRDGDKIVVRDWYFSRELLVQTSFCGSLEHELCTRGYLLTAAEALELGRVLLECRQEVRPEREGLRAHWFAAINSVIAKYTEYPLVPIAIPFATRAAALHADGLASRQASG